MQKGSSFTWPCDSAANFKQQHVSLTMYLPSTQSVMINKSWDGLLYFVGRFLWREVWFLSPPACWGYTMARYHFMNRLNPHGLWWRILSLKVIHTDTDTAVILVYLGTFPFLKLTFLSSPLVSLPLSVGLPSAVFSFHLRFRILLATWTDRPVFTDKHKILCLPVFIHRRGWFSLWSLFTFPFTALLSWMRVCVRLSAPVFIQPLEFLWPTDLTGTILGRLPGQLRGKLPSLKLL